MQKRDQEKNIDSTNHIHQHENTTIVPRHKHEDQIESNNLICLADAILRSRDMGNYKITVVQTRCFWYAAISLSFFNYHGRIR